MLVSALSVVALTTLLAAGPASASSSSSGFNQLERRVTLVDPSASYNFTAVLTTQSSCKRPCSGLLSIASSCGSDNSCAQTSVCTTSGLNSLVTCNNCLLQLANRTTGATEALVMNSTTIVSDTEDACTAASTPAKANTTVIPWSAFVPSSSSSTAKNTTSSETTESIGEAGVSSSSTSKTSTTTSGGLREVGMIKGAGMAGLVVAGLVCLL